MIEMNNKILIGSIIAVAILILVSFTSVVGNNSVDSNVKVSPLFNIRSSRAIQKDGKSFTTDYVGKGEESVLSIPKRDNINSLLQKTISIIREMDEDEIKQLNKDIQNYIQRDSNTNLDEAKQTDTSIMCPTGNWGCTLELECYTNSPYAPFFCGLRFVLSWLLFIGIWWFDWILLG
jgi:hypothetical protein